MQRVGDDLEVRPIFTGRARNGPMRVFALPVHCSIATETYDMYGLYESFRGGKN